MIIKKPYAMLIKYFKIVHIILFVFLTFLLFKFRSIYTFFKDYLANSTYLYLENMASEYVGIPTIFISILLIGLFLLIFLLMKQKKKPIFYYLVALIYSIISFIALVFFRNMFSYLEYNNFSNQSLALLRDLSMVLYFLDFYFLAVAFARGFGFNIKKFNFEKDLLELDITEKDREEIELGSSIDYDKITNLARKGKRNFKYYLKENSYILTIFLALIALGLGSYFLINILVFNKVYRENDKININNIELTINNSYVTNTDKYGNVINKNKKYLIVNFTVLNNNSEAYKFDINNTRIIIKRNYYYPKEVSEFKDLGTIYKGQSIPVGIYKNYIIVFEIEEDLKVKRSKLQFYYDESEEDNQVILYYKNIRIKPKKFKKVDLGTYKLNSSIELKDTYFGDGKFTINSIEIIDKEDYTYTKCDNSEDGTCLDYKATIVSKAGKILLKINYSLTNEFDIFNYLNIEYKINDKIYSIKNNYLNNITPSNYGKNVAFIEVENNIKNATVINLKFDIRGGAFKYEIEQ